MIYERKSLIFCAFLYKNIVRNDMIKMYERGDIMCYITATELKKNLGHYLQLCNSEDICVTKNKKVIAIISNPDDKALKNFFSLRGVLKDESDKDSKEIVGEEIMKKCGF